jgi:hypothetical protein
MAYSFGRRCISAQENPLKIELKRSLRPLYCRTSVSTISSDAEVSYHVNIQIGILKTMKRAEMQKAVG